MSENFFQRLTGFHQFTDLTDDQKYISAPGDWSVMVTDIEGSTKAIEEGRYKIVNMIGASTIAALVNTLKTKDIPFVFGGDGASALFPNTHLDKIKSALAFTREIAKTEHQIKLRIGIVPHQDLIEAGSPVLVGKYLLTDKISLAFFKGQGLTQAEKWIKSGKYLLPDFLPPVDFDVLAGLSCRWAPISNTQGTIVSLIIKFLKDDPKIFQEVLHKLNLVLELESAKSNPVKEEQLSGGGIIRSSKIETSFQSQGSRIKNFLKFSIFGALARLLDLGLIKIKGIDFHKYKKSLAGHSDYRKFDEILRMVIDTTPEKKQRLLEFLERYRASGTLVYGVHESKTALMTCFVQDLEENHLHFIDGGDGGYTLAAKQMKKQLSENSEIAIRP
jgi:hypothetical protein